MTIKKTLSAAKDLYSGVKTLMDQDEHIANQKEALNLLALATQAYGEAMKFQQSYALLEQEAKELAANLDKLSAWFQDEQPKYDLLALANNALVYVLKPDQ